MLEGFCSRQFNLKVNEKSALRRRKSPLNALEVRYFGIRYDITSKRPYRYRATAQYTIENGAPKLVWFNAGPPR